MSHRSQEWWAGWREAITAALRVECPRCREGAPAEWDEPLRAWVHPGSGFEGHARPVCYGSRIRKRAQLEREQFDALAAARGEE